MKNTLKIRTCKFIFARGLPRKNASRERASIRYKFISLTYFLIDILSIVDHLCFELQSDSLNYANFVKSVNTCLEEIQENYVDHEIYGDNFRAFKEKMDKKEFMPHIKLINTPQLVTEAKEIMKEFSKALLRNLKTRFVVDEIVVLFQVLIIEDIRSSNVDIALYGIQEIDKLIDIFGISKTVDKVETQPIIDPIETRSEWRLFKRFIKNNYLDETNEIFWSRIANNLTFKINT